MSNFSDEPTINRKGTLHGLVSKSMLANRLKVAKEEEIHAPQLLSQPPSQRKTSTSSPGAGPLGLPAKPADFLTAANVAGNSRLSAGGKSPGRNSLSLDDRHSKEHDEAEEETDLLAKATKNMMADLKDDPLPLQYVISNLDTRVQATGLYKDLMLFVPFIILFFIFYLNGRNIQENHMSAAAIRQPVLNQFFPKVSRNIEEIIKHPVTDSWNDQYGPPLPQDRQFRDVLRASDFKLWFSDVMVPLIWDCENPDTRHNPLQPRGQHIELGAMQMRVFVMQNDTCKGNPDLMSNYSVPCFGAFDSSKFFKQPICSILNPANPSETLWNYVDPGIISSSRTTGLIQSYPGGGYTATIPFNATCNEALAFAETLTTDVFNAPLTDCGIIRDASTRFVILESFSYNPSTDTFLSSKLFYEITNGGKWISTFQFRAFPVWSQSRLPQTSFDIFFLIFVLYFWYQFISAWLLHYQRYQKALSFLLDAWNIVELTNLVTFLAVLILRFIWWSQSIKDQVNLPFSEGYPQGLDAVVLLYSYQIYANAVNAVITTLKTLKYVRLNNRMNILTRTLNETSESIAGVLLLFIFVVLAYSISGTALYGVNMYTFRNTDQSFATLLLWLFGQFEYDAMRQIEPTFTGIYFFTYTILAQFLLLNFIIAILSEGFAQVSTSTAIEPLDQVLVRQITSLKYTFHPKNMKQWLVLTIHGKSRNDLIFEMLKYLQEHRDLIELQSPELLDNDLPITKHDMKNWLPEHLDQDIGEFYMAILWDDIVHDYAIDILSEDYQEKKDIEALIKKGVLSVVNETVEKFNQVEDRMKSVETAVALLEGYVR